MSRVRTFSFTLNNWTEGDVTRVQALDHKYLLYGKEVGESGTPHLQGMITFANAKTLSAAIKVLAGCHVEIAKDSAALIEYCKKDGDVYEHGTPPVTKQAQGQLEKDRFKRTWDLAKAGNLEDIDPDLRLRFYGTLKKIKQDHQVVPATLSTLDFHWYVGASGTGKSKSARADYPDAYIKNNNKWWDGYENQTSVIIEEWHPDLSCMSSFMKKWCDHYAFTAETKGGTLMARPVTIIVTSNYTIKECFPDSRDHLPLERRFTIKNFNPPAPENPHLTAGAWTSF